MYGMPRYTEYRISEDGDSSLVEESSEPQALTQPPYLMDDIIFLVLERLPLLKQMEFADTSSNFQSATHRMIKKTRIRQIILSTVAEDGIIQLDISICCKEGLVLDFEAHDYKITLQNYLRAFDFLMKLIAVTDCSAANIIIEPEWYPQGLDVVDLPSRLLHHGVVQVQELYFGYGAPLQLYAQIHATTTTVDVMRADVRNGPETIAENLRIHHILPH